MKYRALLFILLQFQTNQFVHSMSVKISPKIKAMSPQFLVADLKQSVTFYTEMLGFGIGFFYGDFYCGIKKDGFSIHLKSGKPAIEERENRRNNEHVDITFSVEGINDLYDELKGKPVRIIQSLRDMPYGREFYIADPDGYIIAFLEELR
jgi:catechol 2,3-dioxygenase-like lactoylglutathione lyase family enzyme